LGTGGGEGAEYAEGGRYLAKPFALGCSTADCARVTGRGPCRMSLLKKTSEIGRLFVSISESRFVRIVLLTRNDKS
jgi:hypothetical protein